MSIKSYEIAKGVERGPQSFFPCMIILQVDAKDVRDKMALLHLVERLRQIQHQVQHIEGIIIATSTESEDDVIAHFCDEHSLHCVRGSEKDILSRYYTTAELFDLEVVVRIQAHCLDMNPELIDHALYCFRREYDTLDYLSNTIGGASSQGMDIEIFRFDALQEAYHHAKLASEREQVTSYITNHPEKFRLGKFS